MIALGCSTHRERPVQKTSNGALGRRLMPWYDIVLHKETDHEQRDSPADRSEASPEEKERHRALRDEIERELPELKQWARVRRTRNRERVAIGTVFSSAESPVVEAIDHYAAEHSLPGAQPWSVRCGSALGD